MYPDENKLDVVPQAGLPEMVLCHQRPHAHGWPLPPCFCCWSASPGAWPSPPRTTSKATASASSISTCRRRCWRSPAMLLAVAGVVGLVWKMKLADVALCRPDRRLDDRGGAGHRCHLGQADLGQLVGVGCPTYVHAYPVSCTSALLRWARRSVIVTAQPKPVRCWRSSAW